MVQRVDGGVYKGISYQVMQEGDRRFIALPGQIAMGLIAAGLDLTALDNIEDNDPEKVLEEVLGGGGEALLKV